MECCVLGETRCIRPCFFCCHPLIRLLAVWQFTVLKFIMGDPNEAFRMTWLIDSEDCLDSIFQRPTGLEWQKMTRKMNFLYPLLKVWKLPLFHNDLFPHFFWIFSVENLHCMEWGKYIKIIIQIKVLRQMQYGRYCAQFSANVYHSSHVHYTPYFI